MDSSGFGGIFVGMFFFDWLLIPFLEVPPKKMAGKSCWVFRKKEKNQTFRCKNRSTGQFFWGCWSLKLPVACMERSQILLRRSCELRPWHLVEATYIVAEGWSWNIDIVLMSDSFGDRFYVHVYKWSFQIIIYDCFFFWELHLWHFDILEEAASTLQADTATTQGLACLRIVPK